MTIVPTILDSIGKTPLMGLRHAVPSQSPRGVLVNLESRNSTGSMKDRIALVVMQGAVSRSQLASGGAVVKSNEF